MLFTKRFQAVHRIFELPVQFDYLTCAAYRALHHGLPFDITEMRAWLSKCQYKSQILENDSREKQSTSLTTTLLSL